MLYFFLSYARGDDSSYVEGFFRDLSEEIRVYAGLHPDDEVGFFDQGSIRVGESWSDQLGQALSSTQTFVALCSPRYFLSETCGREWAAFSARLRADTTGALIPILWVPVRDQPSVVRRFQARPEGREAGVGLRQLLRLSRLRDDYLSFLSDLAAHIVRTAERFPVPAARPTAFDEVVSAFHERPVTAAPAGEHDPRSVVRAAFAAAGRPLEEGRLPNLLVPGPVWVSTTPTPVPDEVRQFADHLTRDRIAYFIHTGDLSLVEGALDRVRLDGRSVVTVPLRALRASLADRNGGSYLRDLERRYGNRDNLFDTKNALSDHRFLFGRDAMLNTVGSALRRDEHVLITGLRKVGKTSLLNVLRQYLVDQPVCTIDLQRFDRHHEDWPPVLFRLMLQAYDSWGHAEQPDWPFHPEPVSSVTALESELRRRMDHLRAPTRLVVILDEVERILPMRGETAALRRWIHASGALRVLAQGDHRSVVLIAADLRPTANRENRFGDGGTNPFFSFFQEMPLPLLDRAGLSDLVRSTAREMGLREVGEDFTTELFRLTGGHPSLARTLAAEAYRQRRDLDRLTGTDLRAGVHVLQDGGRIGFFLRNNLWQLMTAAERAVIGGPVPAEPVPRWELEQARAGLTAQGLLDGDRLRIELFAAWLREYPDR